MRRRQGSGQHGTALVAGECVHHGFEELVNEFGRLVRGHTGCSGY